MEFTYQELQIIAGALHRSIEAQNEAIDALKDNAILQAGMEILIEYRQESERLLNKIIDQM